MSHKQKKIQNIIDKKAEQAQISKTNKEFDRSKRLEENKIVIEQQKKISEEKQKTKVKATVKKPDPYDKPINDLYSAFLDC